MENTHKKVEAILFAVGKEITTDRLASLCSLNPEEVEKIIQLLIQEYSQRDNALKIEKREYGWKLMVKDEFIPIVANLVSSTELEGPLMETLAVIAWKYPIVQSEVVKLRGSGAYEHMRELIEQGFVEKEKSGRTYKVKLTKKFFEYFDLPSAEAKKAFLNQVPPTVLQEAEKVEKEADEVERLIERDKQEQDSRSEIKEAMTNAKKSA
ncbi:MAG TPA: SMC-Scp complex subunit ScpB [Candidatus Nanoarchaeia archaeon]|nr:SMC-Scp complex subunit ScpB [Candidatus Nanoarchaeia archaeon]